ncbi:MAG: YraN family protein [Gammaproteobacteria bacterium]
MTADVQTPMSHGSRGRQAEEFACHYLQGKGFQLIERNYRCVHGEIDLIMLDGHSIVFVEVRYRRSQSFGGGIESVDYRKQAKLIATAAHYLQRDKKAARQPSRFDVVAVSPGSGQDCVEWIKDAFRA